MNERILCEGCPPVGYPTNKTRCADCPRGCEDGARISQNTTRIDQRAVLPGVARPLSAVQRLHNICDGLSEQADESPFTREEWERVDKHAVEQQNRIRELEAEVSTLREHLAEVNRLLSLNVAEAERLRASHEPRAPHLGEPPHCSSCDCGAAQPPGVLSGCAVRAAIQLLPSVPPPAPVTAEQAKIIASFAHGALHIFDDYSSEDSQTGNCTVEIPDFAWKELCGVLDSLGDDPHEVMHDAMNACSGSTKGVG